MHSEEQEVWNARACYHARDEKAKALCAALWRRATREGGRVMAELATTQFGALLRHHRQAAGLTQEELGERAGLSRRGINDLERGVRSHPRRDTVALLAAALGLSEGDRAEFEAAARRSAASATTDPPAHDRGGMASALPTGTITLFFSDIAGSTRLLEHLGATRYSEVLATHQRLLCATFEAHRGSVVDTQGDAFFVTFSTASAAVAAAADAQHALQAHPWPQDAALRIRIGLHAGAPALVGDHYIGLDVHHAARIAAAGHGGQVLLSQAVYELVRDELPADVLVRDLGTHRLRDLQRPERIYQLVAPDLPADFPPLRSLEAFTHNLPIQLTSFIGREREVSAVAQLLTASRLVTLTGSGGCGKTRLSLQVGAAVLDRFIDGVWLVELASLSDPALVPQAVATTLSVREEPGRPLITTLVEHLRAKCLLLLLDNCEHLIEACAHLADTLLRTCPKLVILASSREALGIVGEQLFRVPSLNLPGAGPEHSVAQAAECEAVRLLVERATAVQPSFALTEHNVAAVEQICWRLDGIPLALELASARLRALTVEQVAQRLDDRFHLLTGGSRATLPRQQTLRALIDWSHDLLSTPERIVLRRLSVFVGGWTLEAAEAVCADDAVKPDQVLDLLMRLVDKSLILVDEQQAAARYRLLETVRQYANEKLVEAGEVDVVRDRHLAWYLAMMEEARSSFGTMRQYGWGPRLTIEYDNLLSALEWSRAQPSETEVELRLAAAMVVVWVYFGHISAGRAALEEALARSDPAARTRARALALSVAGQLAGMQMDMAAASAQAGECVAILRELGDKQELAYTLNALVVAAMRQGDEEPARSLQAEIVALFQETGQNWGLATSRFIWGDVALERGEYEHARAQFEESLALLRKLGDRYMVGSPLTCLGKLACVEGDYTTARALIEEGLAVRKEVGDKWNTAISLNSLGDVARCEGNHEQAASLFQEALALNRELSDHAGIAWSLHNLAHVALRTNNHRRAAELFGESLTIRVRQDYKVGVASDLAGIASVALRLGQTERAVWLFGAVEALLMSIHGVLAPADNLVYDRDLATVRAQFDEATFTTAWDAGHRMPFKEAIAEALVLDSPPSDAPTV